MDTQADDYLAITRSLRAESIENKKLAFGNKNILGDESHQNSLDHNIFNDHSYLSESDNSYINKPESYEQNENNDKPFSSEMNQRNSLSAIRKSISKKASTLVNGSNQRILEQATKKALNNVALKMADSSNKKQSLKDPLNSSLLSKHLEGADHHKASKSFSNQKSRTNQTSARSRITKKNEINENIILVSQSNKSSAGRLKTQKNKAISMNNSFTEKLDSNTISTLNINIQNQTLPAPCSANQVDEIQKIRSLESYIEKNGIVEGSQHIETEVTEPFEDNIIEKYSMQLIGAIQKMSIRTFLTLRSIIKPNENILICCQAFVKLFAGLNEAIPPSFSIMENIEWENIKVLFNSPVKILKLISTLSVFIEYKKIPQRNINAAIAALSKIPYELDDIQNEAFYQLYEYIVSAIEYYKYYKPKNIPSGEFNWASVQATPTMRVSTLHQESPIHTAESTRTISPNRKKKASMISCKESPSLRTMTSPDIKSKTPLRQLKSNLFTKSTCASTRRKAGVTVSPFKTPPSCKSVHGLPRNPSLQDVNNEKKSTLTNSVTLKMNQSAKSSISPLRSFTNSMQNKRTHESLESQYFTQATTECDQDFNNTKSLIMKTDVSEAANFFDEISQKRRESLSYKAKVSRLLADHERYIKKTLKSQEEERERAEREFHSYDRTKFEEYQERIKKEEEIYERDLKREEFQAQREAKVQKAKVHQLKINDEMMETTKHRVFITAQAEKKKHEKKKELWDQYKKKMEEKLAKKQKEANIIQAQKKEAYDNKIENVEWKKKQAAQEKEKWANNYLILSKLIGEAK